MYDQVKAEQHLQKLLKWYSITVIKWRTTSSGNASWRKKEIQIPTPTNADRFGVCMHEIKHIIDGKKGKRFEQEFACDMFAREQMIQLNTGGIAEWDKRTNWHCLSRIAMAVNRGLSVSKIPKHITDWFADVDFATWVGKTVFVGHNPKEQRGYSIALADTLPKSEVEMLLGRKGLMMEKSQADDSTYGHWIVRGNGQQYGSEFSNLSEVVNHYQLAQ